MNVLLPAKVSFLVNINPATRTTSIHEKYIDLQGHTPTASWPTIPAEEKEELQHVHLAARVLSSINSLLRFDIPSLRCNGTHSSWAFEWTSFFLGILSHVLFLAVRSLLINMFNDNTNLDVESTDHEQPVQNELDPLIQPDMKVPSKREMHVARAQFFTLCWTMFVMGWTNSSTGPLLPRIQICYDVGFGAASWIFVLLRTGIIMGALLNIPMTDRLGLGWMLVLGALFQIAAYIVQFLAPPYPAFALSFALAGIGNVFQSTSANGYATLLKDSDYKQGFIQAGYGVGALVGPLSATYFAQSTIYWSRHYLVSLSLAVWNMVILAGVFKFQPLDVCLRQAGEIVPDKNPSEEIHENKFSQLMKNKTVHLFAVFLMIYTGIEITIAGWIVTFMIIIRGGGPSSGYVATGFFGGLTLGRVILVEVTKKIGAANAIYVYILLAMFFQLIVWLVPSFNAAAISISIIGILIGPIFPIALNHTPRVLPRHLVNGTMGWISAFGSCGSTLISYISGQMASQLGIESLQPLLLAMMIIMGIIWVFVPKKYIFTC